jgi:hypothetical protein
MSKDRYGTGTDLRREGGRRSSAQESFLDHFFGPLHYLRLVCAEATIQDITVGHGPKVDRA